MPERWSLCLSVVSHGHSTGQVSVAGTVDGRVVVQADCLRRLFLEGEFISRPVPVRFMVD